MMTEKEALEFITSLPRIYKKAIVEDLIDVGKRMKEKGFKEGEQIDFITEFEQENQPYLRIDFVVCLSSESIIGVGMMIKRKIEREQKTFEDYQDMMNSDLIIIN